MKNKVLTFITGILVGAIFTTIGFLIYGKLINNNVNPNQFEKNPMNGEMGEPPVKPEVNTGM